VVSVGQKISVLAALLLVVCTVPAVAVNQIVNGSFEDGVVGFWQNPSDQPLPPPWNKWYAKSLSWSINVDGHDNVPTTPPPDGEHCASACGGLATPAGGIWQEVDVLPGLPFLLSGMFYAGNQSDASTTVVAQFWLFNSPPSFNPTTGDLVTVGGVAALDYSGPRTANWTGFRGGGLTSTGERIYVVSRFKLAEGWGVYGMHMDSLTLHVVPEPGTLVSLIGLGGMLGFAIRRAKNSERAGRRAVRRGSFRP